MMSYQKNRNLDAGALWQKEACLQIYRKSQNFYRDTDRNFSVLSDKVLGDTSLHYTQELSVALSLVNFSSYSVYFLDLFFQ